MTCCSHSAPQYFKFHQKSPYVLWYPTLIVELDLIFLVTQLVTNVVNQIRAHDQPQTYIVLEVFLCAEENILPLILGVWEYQRKFLKHPNTYLGWVEDRLRMSPPTPSTKQN